MVGLLIFWTICLFNYHYLRLLNFCTSQVVGGRSSPRNDL